jgi:hypothetical protein
MHAQGGRAIDGGDPKSLPGEIMIVPSNNTDFIRYDSKFFDPLQELQFPVCPCLATMQEQVGAGFYSGIWGPMPFVFGPTPMEEYAIWRLKLDSPPNQISPDQE